MNIGIIVYSQTNNTYSVAQKLQNKLSAEGHQVNLERVEPAGKVNPGEIKVNFNSQPDIDPYDALIFGSPVHAFNLAPAMNAYLNQIPSLQDKKIACFVTKGLPFDSTGGNQAIKQMKNVCRSRGGTVIGTAIVTWSMSRKKKINNLVERFGALF
jgi:flavodoxin